MNSRVLRGQAGHVNSVKSERVMPPGLFFFLRIGLTVLGLSWFHINFTIICSNSVKNVMDNLIGIVLNS